MPTTTPVARTRWRRAALLASAALLALPAVPAQAASPDPALTQRLVTVVDGATQVKATNVAGYGTGVLVLDGATGAEIYARRAYQPLTPASNNKVLTGATAMGRLGEGYRWWTDVHQTGTRTGSTVAGDLWIKGYGDPTLLESDLDTMARSIRAQGTTTFTGRLMVDQNFFDSSVYSPYWSTSYASHHYAPQVTGLTLSPDTDYDIGTIIIGYSGGTYGYPGRLTVTPPSAASYVKLVNKTVTRASGTATGISVSRTLGTNTITVTGNIASSFTGGKHWVTVHDPALYAAHVFRKALARQGVTVLGGTAKGTLPTTNRLIARDYSPVLRDVMVPYMKLSNNGIAEVLSKTMWARATGRSGTWAGGEYLVKQYVWSLTGTADGLTLVDGSGLASANKVPARQLATVLHRIQAKPWFPAFKTSLPVAGIANRMVGGTLKSRMVGTIAAGHVSAKTGTLNNVTALSGYATGADGRTYVFSMIGNYPTYSTRPVEDSLAITLAGWVR